MIGISLFCTTYWLALYILSLLVPLGFGLVSPPPFLTSSLLASSLECRLRPCFGLSGACAHQSLGHLFLLLNLPVGIRPLAYILVLPNFTSILGSQLFKIQIPGSFRHSVDLDCGNFSRALSPHGDLLLSLLRQWERKQQKNSACFGD